MSKATSLAEVHAFVREGRMEEAKRALDKDRALTTTTDDSGRYSLSYSSTSFLYSSVLHLAAVAGLLPLVQLAVQGAGVGADTEDDIGWTALMCAASSGKMDVVRFLLTQPEVNSSHRNKNGQTPLHYAASKGHPEIVSLLLENGAEVNGRDKWGASALHRAASQGRDKIVSLLLGAKGINMDAKDGEGKTPLYLACDEGRVEAAVSLASAGADLDATDNEGKSCVDAMRDSELAEKVIHAARKRRGDFERA